MVPQMKMLVAALAAGLVLATSLVVPASANEPTRIKIASASHKEDGCSGSSKSFKIAIPHPERLDREYKGVLAGIERVYVEANGTRRDGDWAFADNGSALIFSLYSKGGGTRIRHPFNNGNWCHGASGANITVEIYAHYKS